MLEMPINPGLPQTFPWLSQVADAYEEYRIKGMVFQFKSTAGEYVTNGGGASNGGLGTVIMATNYNSAVHPAFLDKKSMENYEFAQSAPPTKNMIHAIEAKGAGTPVKTLYLRTGDPATGTDPRLYDLGSFCIATQGMVTDVGVATIGELWVAYEVEFFKPKYRLGGAKADHFALRYDAALPSTNNLVGGMITTTPFGTAARIDRVSPAISGTNANNGVFAAGSYIINEVGVKSTLVLPQNPGAYYMIEILVRSKAGTQLSTNPTATWARTYTACENVMNWNGNWTLGPCDGPQAATTTTSAGWMFQQLVKVNPPDNGQLSKIDWTVSQIPTSTAYYMDILVSEVNPTLYTNPSI